MARLCSRHCAVVVLRPKLTPVLAVGESAAVVDRGKQPLPRPTALQCRAVLSPCRRTPGEGVDSGLLCIVSTLTEGSAFYY